MRNMGIIHYSLFRNRKNGLQCTYFVKNGLKSSSMNSRFLNIIHKIIQILQQNGINSTNGTIIYRSFQEVNNGDVETRKPQTRGLSVNSIADSLSLNFLVYFAEKPRYFSMKTINKRQVREGIFT